MRYAYSYVDVISVVHDIGPDHCVVTLCTPLRQFQTLNTPLVSSVLSYTGMGLQVNDFIVCF